MPGVSIRLEATAPLTRARSGRKGQTVCLGCDLRLGTMGSASSRAWVRLQARNSVSKIKPRGEKYRERGRGGGRRGEVGAYKVYFKCSSISMIAAWFPHL